jgi:class 3 adenylate cyclase
MPFYLDRHDVRDATPEDIARAHAADMAVQEPCGVRYVTYRFDYERQHTFCLVDAPDEETALEVHRRAHGDLPSEVRPVDPAEVGAFLGRTVDPPQTVAIDEPAFRTIMFTDIVGSTELHGMRGDRRAMDLVRLHDEIIRGALADHSGREIKHTGDGFMAFFRSVSDAVTCGLAIQDRIAADGPEAIRVRIGLNAGEPIDHSNQLFGLSVNLASRLCDAAGPGEVLVSDVVRGLAMGKSFRFEERGDMRFKGFEDPIRVSCAVAASPSP